MQTDERDSLLAELDRSIRRRCRFVGRKVEQLERVTRVTGPTPVGIDNVIMWSDLDSQTASGEIDAHIDYFAGLGHAFEWIAYDYDQPPDLAAMLSERGFQPEREETVVVARADEIADFSPPSGIDLRAINDPSGIADVVAISEAVWGGRYNDFLKRWLTDLLALHPDETIIVNAYDGDKPVGSAWAMAWRDRTMAPLFGGSVVAEYRKRGIYRAMISHRARAVSGRGIEWCLVDAGPESLPISQRHGFQQLTGRKSFCMLPAKSPD